MDDYSGLLLIDKPKGWTSFDVVAKVRGLIRAELRTKNPEQKTKVKVGHTGTLDPSATGLLVICIGKATKLVPLMIKHDKTYEVEMILGVKSTTGDQEGELTKIEDRGAKIGDELFSSISDLRSEHIARVLNLFVGKQMQTPPAFSAIKIDGKRAYDLARAGKEVKLEPRPIVVHSIELIEYTHPKVRFRCSVSSGTYIRSLVVDIAAKIGLDTYMSELRRTVVDTYKIKDAINVSELNTKTINERLLRAS